MRIIEGIRDMIDQALIPITTAQLIITICRNGFEIAMAGFHDANVECAPAQVVDEESGFLNRHALRIKPAILKSFSASMK